MLKRVSYSCCLTSSVKPKSLFEWMLFFGGMSLLVGWYHSHAPRHAQCPPSAACSPCPVLSPVPPPRGKTRCTKAEAEAIAAQLPIPNSNCPQKTPWIHALLAGSFQRPSATLVWIGCNKGDDLLAAAREWSQNVSYDSHRLRAYWQGLPDGGRVCAVKDAEFPVDAHRIRPVRGLCVEPMAATIDVVRRAFDVEGWTPALEVVHAAVSVVPGEAAFPKARAGYEALGIGSAAAETEPVRVVTLDELTESRGLDAIDMLAIDTEGNDVRVLIGGMRTLSRVRYLEFEYHAQNHWGVSSLEDWVDMLDVYLGFDCFWMGNAGQLWQLTGCWHDSYYERRAWSNVACAHRERASELVRAMAEARAQ
jgi:FkbM family methyltransferase